MLDQCEPELIFSFCTAATMFNWTVMAITYFRFQRAMRVQGIDKKEYLHTSSRFLPYACYWALFWAPLFLLVQGYSVFLNGNWKVATFVFNYGIVSRSIKSLARDRDHRLLWLEVSVSDSRSLARHLSIVRKMSIYIPIWTFLTHFTIITRKRLRMGQMESRKRSWPSCFE
jgi:hypothetical protein